MTVGAAFAASVVLFGACTGTGTDEDDPCRDATTTCVRLSVTSSYTETIDELVLDLVYNGHHATTTTGTRGTPLNLPTDTAVILDLPASSQIVLDLIAVAKRNGAIVGGDASSTTVQQGNTGTMQLRLGPYFCPEGELYCGSVGLLYADDRSLYRCTGGIPIFFAQCSSGCTHDGVGATCYGGGLCRDGRRYCGGHIVDGDPFTLYVCMDFDGTAPVRCANGCLVLGDGNDVCQ